MPFLLKNFQQRTVEGMEKFLAALAEESEKYERVPEEVRKEYGEINWPEKAWHELFPEGNSNHAYSAKKTGHGKHCPHFCLKLPTGGGKTLMATYAIEQYLKHLRKEPTGLVLWIVPSEQIFAQTLNALKDRSHPYREKLDDITGGHIKVVTKKDNFSPQDV
ncbi:restriction endonuclease subunit R, partial [Candidatus Peregrinibacteria bacterium CG10_big_fil_rev_8_21_14_0_10_54_7]